MLTQLSNGKQKTHRNLPKRNLRRHLRPLADPTVNRPPPSVLCCPFYLLPPPKVVVKKSAQNMLKTRSFLAKRCKKTLIFDKKMQKSTKKCSFLPSFFAQKQISPIKSLFLLPPTTPIFKISLKNPLFPNFFLFFCSLFPHIYLLHFIRLASGGLTFYLSFRSSCSRSNSPIFIW